VLALAARPGPPIAGLHWIVVSSDPARYGHDLYARLRELDHADCARLLIEELPAGEAWDAPRDRLRRAAAATDTLNDGELP
jgi:L-threonylcarbamoyladenylate synthase